MYGKTFFTFWMPLVPNLARKTKSLFLQHDIVIFSTTVDFFLTTNNICIKILCTLKVKVKVKVKESQSRPRQNPRIPSIWDPQAAKQSTHEVGDVVSPTHRPPLPWYPFIYRRKRPQVHIAAGRIMSMKNSSDTIGNRTGDPLACSAVLELTSPLLIYPLVLYINNNHFDSPFVFDSKLTCFGKTSAYVIHVPS